MRIIVLCRRKFLLGEKLSVMKIYNITSNDPNIIAKDALV